jgi:hypothetical protein
MFGISRRTPSADPACKLHIKCGEGAIGKASVTEKRSLEELS